MITTALASVGTVVALGVLLMMAVSSELTDLHEARLERRLP